jgi:hypothetical protein
VPQGTRRTEAAWLRRGGAFRPGRGRMGSVGCWPVGQRSQRAARGSPPAADAAMVEAPVWVPLLGRLYRTARYDVAGSVRWTAALGRWAGEAGCRSGAVGTPAESAASGAPSAIVLSGRRRPCVP